MEKIGKYIIKILTGIIITVVVIILGTGILFYFKAESYINQNISRYVAEKSDNLYHLKFDKIELTRNPLSISVSNVSFKPDKSISDKIALADSNKVFYSFHSPTLRLNDFKPLQLLKKKIFICEKITIVQPEFSIIGEGIFQNDSTQNINQFFRGLKPLFQNRLKEIQINEIHFVDANYKLYQSVKNDIQVSNAQKISMEIKSFRTDSTMISSNSTFFESDDILISINQFQNNLSDSIHFLTIDTLEYSLKTTDISANGFHLFHKEKNSNKHLYDVVVPKLRLKSRDITSFSLKDSLNIQYLNFENPQIKFYQKENKKRIQIEDLNQFDLYSLIEDQFTKIKIDSFVLSNSNLKIFQQPNIENYQQHFESLTILLNGFDLDSTSAHNQKKLFHADNLNMQVSGYHLRLEDNQHQFTADSMLVSTSSNKLAINNIQIEPTNKNEIKTRTKLKVKCEALDIDNVNLKTLYHTRTLPTRRISVTNPDVQLQYHSEILRVNKKKESGLLYQLVSAYLEGVYSEVVEIKNGNLNIQTLSNDILKGYFETGFNFNLSGFALDSASMQQTNKFFYAGNFDLQFTDYQMKLADNLHKINVDNISIQSFDRKLQIENLILKPVVNNVGLDIMQSYNRSELYNITIPKITLWGINLRDAFFFNKLNIDRFHVTKPKIYFENFGILRKKKEKTDFSEFYQLISNYIYDFNIHEITIPNGNFKWINHTKKSKTTTFDNEFSATLLGFKLNEKELNKERLLFSDNFEISVKEQQFQLSDSVHVLQAGEINLSSKKAGIEIKDALLYPLTSTQRFAELPTTFQVSIPEIDISKIDFLKAYKYKQLQLGSVVLNDPRFKIYTKSGASKSLDLKKFDFPLPAFIESFELDLFKINNGEVINYETDKTKQHAKSNFKINLSLPKVSLNKTENNRANITSQNLIVKLFDFNASLGKRHELKMAALDFNKNKKSISIFQLNVNSFGLKQKENRFTISAPQIQFSDFDIDKAIQHNIFEFDKIKFHTPYFEIEVNDTVKGSKLEFANNLDLYPIVESYVNRIKVNQLQFQNVDLNFNWFKNELVNKRFNLSLKDIDISENVKSNNLLNSREFELSTTQLKQTSKNGLYEFSADSLIYNSAKHSSLLKNVRVKPIFSNEEFHKKIKFQTDFLNAQTDFIELKGIDENQWLKNKTLRAKELVVGKSQINIFRNKRIPFNSKQRPPWPQDLLKELKQPFTFDSVFLSNSTLRYSELLDLSDKPGYIDFDNLSFSTGKISNIEKEILKKPNLIIDASAQLYKQGQLNIQYKFDLSSNVYEHKVSGKLDAMPIKSFNAMVDKSTPISIESGQINRFDFEIDFNDTHANGELFLGYDNLKISVLEQKMQGVKKSKFASFWANKMVLNSKHPKGDKFLPTSIYYERDVQRSIINFWWKALFTGSKETIGIKPDKQTN